MTEPRYLSVLHEVESEYGSISNAPPEEVMRVQKAAGATDKVAKRPMRERGKQWKQFLQELDTEDMTSYEILMLARKDERLSKNWHITIGAVYHAMKKYGIKYKKMNEV